MPDDMQLAPWNEVEFKDAEAVAFRQVEGAVAFMAVFATFAAVVFMFWV